MYKKQKNIFCGIYSFYVILREIYVLIPILVTSITISPNGNSPEMKMVGGMAIDVQKGFVPSRPKVEGSTIKKNIDKTKVTNINSTKLAINERYRRLIPYMTFYYANDLLPPTTEAYNAKSVEVEKAQIVEASAFETENHRQPKLIYTPNRQHNIPRYQGNRLTHFNIASANPAKIFYNKEGYPIILQNVPKEIINFNSLPADHNVVENPINEYRRYIPKEPKIPNNSYRPRKPYPNVYHDNEDINAPFYPEREEIKYQLVPYDQTPPIRNLHLEFNNAPKKTYNIPATVLNDAVYAKPRPRPQYHYDEVAHQQIKTKRPPITISESYYEKQNTLPVLTQPVIETGFKPIISQAPEKTVAPPIYTPSPEDSIPQNFDSEKAQIESVPITHENNEKSEYYQYVDDTPTHKPPIDTANAITLADLLNSLQLNKSIPKPITKENVGSSIRILLQALNALKGKLQQNEAESPVLSSPAPFEAPKNTVTTEKAIIPQTAAPLLDESDFNEGAYLAEVENPSQHLDDYTSGTSQRFPLLIESDEEGGTPGRPGIDYPTLTVIPNTKFNCKTQRYKGFFADPETRCQVWHYCDLNGGQASFLCPNGTIFSQAALTCDWWFNVKCSSTTQLYVLNESLYKYILPHSPKFPEDYSGPLVDKYLTLKFKEMEEEFKKNKNKNKQSDSEEKVNDESEERSNADDNDDNKNSETNEEKDDENNNSNKVSESSVIVATSGASGNVQRLEE